MEIKINESTLGGGGKEVVVDKPIKRDEILRKGFKDRVRDARIRAELSKPELADIIGVGYYSLCDYERGYSVPLLPRIIKIADATRCNLRWLATGEGEPWEGYVNNHIEEE